jgi:hypothetical protein
MDNKCRISMIHAQHLTGTSILINNSGSSCEHNQVNSPKFLTEKFNSQYIPNQFNKHDQFYTKIIRRFCSMETKQILDLDS